jgi:hypothetical protein
MALHNELPIYKVAYDLLRVVIEASRNMPREVKQQVGGELRDECIKITILIFRANVAVQKAPHLLELIERLQVVELLIRLSRDLRFIDTKRYAAVIALTGSIGKQANGWRRQSSSSPAT